MLIVGNSHVSVFSRGARLIDAPEAPFLVHWVGALEIDHFFTDHPAGRKVRQLFAQEAGWKFLMIGNHDTFKMLRMAQSHPVADVLDHVIGQYQQVFTELAAGGQFGWMLGVQQTKNVPVAGVGEQQVLSLSQTFAARLADWCESQGIPIINPLDRICGEGGKPHAHLLRADGLHLRPEAAPLYFDSIRTQTGIGLQSQAMGRGETIEPLTEAESFSDLLMTELGVPVKGVSREAIQDAVLAFLRERLSERGLEVPLDPDTDFVNSGLLDSLDLVEVYTFASEWLGRDLDFEVNLRELDTVRKLVEQLLPERNDMSGWRDEVTQNDFLISLRGDFNDPEQRPAILAAEMRIGREGHRLRAAIGDVLNTTTGGLSPYGIVSLWLALCSHHEGLFDHALQQLTFAANPDQPFPCSASVARHYLETWSRIPEKIPTGGEGIEFELRATPRDYPVSAIVSTYNSERFLRGCLDDLLAQTIRNGVEIVIIDSASQQKERAIVEEYCQRFDNITYIRTINRESVYQAWNRGIAAASGKYLTNANTDDRHRPDAFERMVQTLEAMPDVALVYADVLITEVENETFSKCTPAGQYRWFDWDRHPLLHQGCFMGPQPMWRSSLHEEYGLFDGSFVTSGDYEFWLRISQTNHFFHIPEFLGLYLASPTSIEHANRDRQVVENQRILRMYQSADAIGTLIRRNYRDESSHLLQVHNRKGEELFEAGEVHLARMIFEQILERNPALVEPLNNLGVVLFQMGELERASCCFEGVLQQTPHHLEAMENLAQCYWMQDKHHEASQLLEPLLRLAPENMEARETLDLCLAKKTRVRDDEIGGGS